MRRAGRLRDCLAALLAAAAVTLVPACDEPAMRALADQVVFDLRSIPFTADREFTALYDGESLTWVEHVESAGDGAGISIALVSRNGKVRHEITDPAEVEDFDRLSTALATGGGPRALFQRDPAPDGLERMLASYRVSVIELGREPINVRGEPSLTYMIEPNHDDRPFYVLTVSTGHGREGFPLASQEYVRDASGIHLVSHMTVLAFDWRARPAVEPPPSPITSRTSLASIDAARRNAAASGLTLLLPRDDALPSGFELIEIEEISLLTDANTAREPRDLLIYRFVYSDGVEHIDFIEHTPIDTMPDAFIDSSLQDLAMISRFGSITSGSLLHKGTQLTIESRIAADRFETLMRALVEL